jgi:transcriptional regulator with XRE-family HTH domain
MEMHIGSEIKKILDDRGLPVTEFARRINKSRENAYSIFTRKSIDTELLKKISEVLNYDFFIYYSPTYKSRHEEISKLQEENEMLREYNLLLRGKATGTSSK